MTRRELTGFALMACLAVTGCNSQSGDMGDVHGTVTMDGKPLPNATVMFQPVSGERGSVGSTDENGYYELQYTISQDGARVGEHKVKITTYSERTSLGDGTFGPGTPETVPSKYNVNTELTRTVEPGDNEINFELKSEGEIFDRSTPGTPEGELPET